MDSLQGVVDRIIYFNEFNNYTVFDLDVGGVLEVVTGLFPNLAAGEAVTVYGHFVEHKTYGAQFQAEKYEIYVPTNSETLQRYLASGLIKGIGESRARDLVMHFGEDVLDIIKNEPSRLTEVSGIGSKTAQQISETYTAQEEMREVVMFMQQFGISTTYAMKIYKKYCGLTIGIISQNPYRMIDDVDGIGFKTADKIALSMGIEEASAFRVRAGISHVMAGLYSEGNMFYEEDKLIEDAAQILNVEEMLIEDGLSYLTKNGKVILCSVDETNVYYLRNLYIAETEAAKRLIKIACIGWQIDTAFLSGLIVDYEKQFQISLHESQKQAVISCMTHGLSIVTGGPGTGKTTIINCILFILKRLKQDVVLAAPTGRAAKRMSQSCDAEAKTIHRMLEYTFATEDRMSFGKDEENQLQGDYLIIDEASMLDITLLYYTLKAMNENMRLILVGDVDQLPSVAPGNILKDIIDSGQASVVKLDKIFRQSERSKIIVNAHRINMGKYPEIDNASDDFFFIDAPSPQQAAQVVGQLCSKRLVGYQNYDPYYDIQVISHVKKGQTGVEQLNAMLQRLLNPPSKEKNEKTMLKHTIRVNDKVMQIRNNYRAIWTNIFTQESGTGVFNGDIGVVERIDDESRIIDVLFEKERRVHYAFEDADQLMLSYAITTHKSQGSEFKAVVIPVCEGYRKFLSRNLLYTALTRAKEMAVLVGSRQIIESMVRNNTIVKRKTALCWRMMDEAVV